LRFYEAASTAQVFGNKNRSGAAERSAAWKKEGAYAPSPLLPLAAPEIRAALRAANRRTGNKGAPSGLRKHVSSLQLTVVLVNLEMTDKLRIVM
jgi:hypothetical protein